MITDTQKEELYRDYYGKVRRYIRSKIDNAYEAEDIAANVFLKIYEKIDSFDETKASLSTWIYTVMRNTLTDYFRTRKVINEIPESFSEDSSLEDDVCNADMLEKLADALETLDERERNIIILKFYSGITLREISSRLGISYTYVKVLYNGALKKLRLFFDNILTIILY